MWQDVVQLILHSAEPISGTVCGHTKKVHVGIRLDGRNLTRQVWSMIDERENSREARRPLQVMEVVSKYHMTCVIGRGPPNFASAISFTWVGPSVG